MLDDVMAVTSKLDLNFIFRIVLPGLVLVLLLTPILNPIVPSIVKINKILDLAIILIPEAIILGMLLSLLRNPIYRIYEGRLLWPRFLHDRLTDHINKRIKRKMKEQEDIVDKSSPRYKEIWYWLRIFPIDNDNNGDPIARRPTTLGNILEGYEGYSKNRYGMDSIFYWYRLQPKLPENFIKTFNMLFAEADCLLNISFCGIIMFLLCTVISIVKRLDGLLYISFMSIFVKPLSLTKVWIMPEFWAICSLVCGYIIYRISLPLHRRNGEYYKSAFDLYRGEIDLINNIPIDEKSKWSRTWSFLQYMFIQCQNCQKYHFADSECCPHCNEAGENKLNSSTLKSATKRGRSRHTAPKQIKLNKSGQVSALRFGVKLNRQKKR